MKVKYFDWNKEKNILLKKKRGVSFEDLVNAVIEGSLLDIIDHPNKEKFSNQQVFVIEFDNYVYLIPFVEDEEKYFLKTLYPSRKMTNTYLIERRKK